MSDLFETVKGGQDALTKLISNIPGFKGYVARSQRRAADKLLRDQVALKYRDLAERTSSIEKDLAEAGQLDFIDDVEAIGLKLRTFCDRIKNASYGYSGFFDTVKINEQELAQIYTFDAAFFDLANQVSNGLDNIEAGIGGDGLKSAIRSVNDLVRQVIKIYDRRYQVLTGAGDQQ